VLWYDGFATSKGRLIPKRKSCRQAANNLVSRRHCNLPPSRIVSAQTFLVFWEPAYTARIEIRNLQRVCATIIIALRPNEPVSHMCCKMTGQSWRLRKVGFMLNADYPSNCMWQYFIPCYDSLGRYPNHLTSPGSKKFPPWARFHVMTYRCVTKANPRNAARHESFCPVDSQRKRPE
jgi:hypothetical protein